MLKLWCGSSLVLLVVGACGGGQDTSSTWPPSAYPVVDYECLNRAHEKLEAGAASTPAAPTGNEKKAPIEVPPSAIAGKRISGSIMIVPDEETKREIRGSGVSRVCPSFELCLDEGGVPSRIEILRPSCFPRYDAEIIQRVEQWRYSPYSIDGVPVAVCTELSVAYSQSR